MMINKDDLISILENNSIRTDNKSVQRLISEIVSSVFLFSIIKIYGLYAAPISPKEVRELTYMVERLHIW